MEWYLKVMRQYADFNGRARRKEYWMFFLFNMIFAVAAIIADNLIGFTFGEIGYGFFYAVYVLAVFIPALAVTIRRLHDTGKSGYFYLIALIPIIGGIWLLIVLCQDGDFGDNRYGSNPKDLEVEFQ